MTQEINWCGRRDLNPGSQLGKLSPTELDYDRTKLAVQKLLSQAKYNSFYKTKTDTHSNGA